MRCKACNSPNGHYSSQLKDYYCLRCKNIVIETIVFNEEVEADNMTAYELRAMWKFDYESMWDDERIKKEDGRTTDE